MKWWNGLWLNESFATFMANLAMEKAMNDPSAPQSLYWDKSGWAYWEDQLSTTHPVDGNIESTEETRNAFDGITYAKGAAVLKQLRFLLGDEDFREGIQRYFMKYALKNTTLAMFLKMLAEGSGKNLTQWRKDWLQSSGVNTIQVTWACEDTLPAGKSKLSKLKITQQGSDTFPNPRTHKALLGFFKLKNGRLEIMPQTVEANYSQAENEITSGIGKDCPDFVFPNYRDYDYVKVQFDTQSLDFIKQNLSKFKDPLDRQMLWYTLWEMTREGKFKTQEFIDLIITHAKNENDSYILNSLLPRIARPDLNGLSAPMFLTGPTRAEYQAKIEKFIYQLLMKSVPGSDIQPILFKAVMDSTVTPKQVELLKKVYKGTLLLPGIKIDQEKKWDILEVLARNNDTQAADWIQEERKIDTSDSGMIHSMKAEMAFPKDENKKKWIAILNRTPTDGIELPPLAKIMSVLGQYHMLNQEDYTKSSVDSYFGTLTQLAQNPKVEDEIYASNYALKMYPLLCESGNLDRISGLIKKVDLPPSISKKLMMNKNREEYCIKARALAAQGSDPTPAPASDGSPTLDASKNQSSQ
jgi:aminopeptidase N